jgi:fatty acid desaturase
MKASDFLSREEINELLQKNNWKGAYEIAHTWFFIIAAFVLAGYFTNVLTVFIALWILGGKQLACAIIMHDASHHSIFTGRKVNDWVGNWLGAYPIFLDVQRYRPYHIQHHVHTGQDNDPDLSLTTGYPAKKKSMMRKFLRDLTGITGIKTYIGALLIHTGYLKFTLNGRAEKDTTPYTFAERVQLSIKNLAGPLVFQIIMLTVFILLGKVWLFGLWWAALLTTHQFCLRVRSIAEHAVSPDRKNPFTHTRTTYANFFEKMLFAPHHVNYHAEHHLMMQVPCYNYPKMHQMLKQKGFYEKGLLEPDYSSVLKLATLNS